MEKVKSVDKKIAILGGGHIGVALALGLVKSGRMLASNIVVSSPHLAKINHLKKYGVRITANNVEAVSTAEWVFLAVKPSRVQEVLLEIKDGTRKRVIISLAAGVTIEALRNYTKSSSVSFVRIMPNIPIAYNVGVVGLFSGVVATRELSQLKYVLGGLGFVLEVDKERDLEILTVVSGSGPAVVSYCIDAVASAGEQLGLSEYTARVLSEHTFKGTSLYLEATHRSPKELIESVATKGGITEVIIGSLKKGGLHTSVLRALKAGYTKIKSARK